MKKFILALCFVFCMMSTVIGMEVGSPEPTRVIRAPYLTQFLPRTPSLDSLVNTSYEELPNDVQNIQSGNSDQASSNIVFDAIPVSESSESEGSIRYHKGSVRYHLKLHRDNYPDPSFLSQLVSPHPSTEPLNPPSSSNSAIPNVSGSSTDSYPPPSLEPPPADPAPPPLNPPPDQSHTNQSRATQELNEWGSWLSQVPHSKVMLCVGTLFAGYGAVRCFNDRKKYWPVIKPFLKKYLPLLLAKKKKRKKQKNKVYLLPTT